MTSRLQLTNRLIVTTWEVALVVIAGMTVWPPWAVEPYNSELRRSMGYHAIWSAEQTVRQAAPAEAAAQLARDSSSPMGINYFQLIIQCFVTAVAAMSATFLIAVFRPMHVNLEIRNPNIEIRNKS